MESLPINIVSRTLLRSNDWDMTTIHSSNNLGKPRMIFIFDFLSIWRNVNIFGYENSDNNFAYLFYNTADSGFPNTKQVCDRSIMSSVRKPIQCYCNSMTHCNGFPEVFIFHHDMRGKFQVQTIKCFFRHTEILNPISIIPTLTRLFPK